MKKILSIILVLVMILTIVPTNFTVFATGSGVQQKLNEIKNVYPTGSYFTSTGKSHDAGGKNCPQDCNICKLQAIPSRGGLPAGNTTNASGKRWQCYAFASYAAYIIFGDANVVNWGQVSINNAKLGDIVYFGFNHWGVFLYTEGNNVVVYDGNYDGYCGVRYGSSYSKTNISKIYRSPNYDKVNGPHTHNYNQYVYYWAAHPHYKCYKCSCGAVKENTSETTYVGSCEQCNPPISYTSITSGKYFLRNKASGNYLNVAYSEDKDLTRIHLTPFGDYEARVYNIYAVSNGYEIMPLTSKTRVVNPYCTNVVAGKTVNLYHKTNESSQWWKFQKVSDGYIIRNVQNSKVCITNSSADNVTVENYTGANNQIWYLEKACTVKYNANGGSNAPSPQRFRAGYGTKLSTQKPTKSCSKFLGWSNDKNDTLAVWSSGVRIAINGDLTVYAIWRSNHSYTNACDSNCNDCGYVRSSVHKYKQYKTTDATTSKNGKKYYECTECGKTKTTTIYMASKCSLSATSYTYNGSTKKPSVKIYDSKGNKLTYGEDYTYKRPSSSKKVGKYTIKVTFKGDYSGTKNLYYTINPPKTSVSSLTAGKKSLKVKLKKQSSQTSGYEIQYSTSKSFKSAKVKKISRYKTTTTTLKSLSAKKTYYVRVRTYKTVSGKKYYSSWSSCKYKKTK